MGSVSKRPLVAEYFVQRRGELCYDKDEDVDSWWDEVSGKASG